MISASAILAFGGVTTLAIISILIMAVRNVWPARKPVLLMWGVFAVYVFDIVGAIRWLILGTIKVLNNIW